MLTGSVATFAIVFIILLQNNDRYNRKMKKKAPPVIPPSNIITIFLSSYQAFPSLFFTNFCLVSKLMWTPARHLSLKCHHFESTLVLLLYLLIKRESLSRKIIPFLSVSNIRYVKRLFLPANLSLFMSLVLFLLTLLRKIWWASNIAEPEICS